MALRTLLSVSLAISVCFLAACAGGGENYRIPADHPIKPFEEPEREDLVQEEEDAWDIDYDEVEEEESEEEAEEEEEVEEPGESDAETSSEAESSVESSDGDSTDSD